MQAHSVLSIVYIYTGSSVKKANKPDTKQPTTTTTTNQKQQVTTHTQQQVHNNHQWKLASKIRKRTKIKSNYSVFTHKLQNCGIVQVKKQKNNLSAVPVFSYAC